MSGAYAVGEGSQEGHPTLVLVSQAGELEAGPLDERGFDDLFVELYHPPEFLLEGAGRRIEVRFEQGYPCAQVYGPAGEEHVCFEPMTAPTNALVSGAGLRLVPPGGRYVGCFSISVTPH